MTSILLHQIWHQGKEQDILIQGNRFASIKESEALENYAGYSPLKVLECKGKAILPAFYNGHTHAAMNLLRGYADDMPLSLWLNEHIWPIEAKMTSEDMYHGVKLAILEMIKTGTVFFNDMYFSWDECMSAVEEMGLRAVVADSFIDHGSESYKDKYIAKCKAQQSKNTDMLRFAVAPHAIYTVGEDMLKRCAEVARESDTFLHIHLAETEQEVKDCLSQHGMTPTEYLHSLGLLGPKTILAHSVWLSQHDMDLLKESASVLVHNPCSNMKLASGIFPSKNLIDNELKVILGTDGVSSNNNLDMREEMKFAALLAKVRYGAEALPADKVLQWATVDAARAFGLNAGEIAEGKLADAIIVDLSNDRLIPNHHLVSNWVYAADSSAIESVLCNGCFLMENHVVPHEDEIKENAMRVAHYLVKRVK